MFTGLPTPTPLDSIVVSGARRTRVLAVVKRAADAQPAARREHLCELHAVWRIARSRSVCSRWRVPRARLCNFLVSDYVLRSHLDKHLQGGKLLVRWVGPSQVLQAIPHSFQIKYVISGDKYDVHGSRLEFYYDAELQCDCRDPLAHHMVLEVRDIVGHRTSHHSGDMEPNVAWRSLEDVEIS
jgi:hypothetical protein